MFNKCQIFTPEEYTRKMLDIIGYNGKSIIEKKVLENSCGDGQILKIIVEKLINEMVKSDMSNLEIKEVLKDNVIGFEIDENVYSQCIDNLNAVAQLYNIENVQWSVYNEDYLKTSLSYKVDYIVGNPPYITYQELLEEERIYLRQNFISCSKGKFDYCYPFIEKSINDLNDFSGKMAYLIPSSIFKNVFGNNLRDIILPSLTGIYDYRGTNIFENALVSSSIIQIDMAKIGQEYLDFTDVASNKKICVEKKNLSGKWKFFEIEETTLPQKKIKDYFKVSNSVATLLNDAFVVKEYTILDNQYVCCNKMLIERSILREAASPRGKNYNKKELIIFPYYYENSILKEYSEQEFFEKFPKTYEYLETFKSKLEKRKSDKKANWFEYGRSQALKYLDQEKLMLSSVVTDKVKIYNLSKETIPYSGFYIIPTGSLSLSYAKEILETSDFYEYLQIRGINANGKSLRFSVNDFMEYPIPNAKDSELNSEKKAQTPVVNEY